LSLVPAAREGATAAPDSPLAGPNPSRKLFGVPSTALAVALLLTAAPGRTVSAEHLALVACAPGWPGTTAEAQHGMDALVSALARSAGLPEGSLSGVYLPAEQDGLARLSRPDAAIVLVPLPFFAKHAATLELEPRLEVVMQGEEAQGDVWTLVAGKGRVTSPAALAGFSLSSSAGYAPGFVRGILAPWGQLPADVRIVQSSQVLSALRKAASGADVAVLLDGAQSRALSTLPFSAELEVVARSKPIPAGVIATIGRRLTPERWRMLERAFLTLPSTDSGANVLAGIQTKEFSKLDGPARDAVRRAAGWGG
jgi:hypothetical protein